MTETAPELGLPVAATAQPWPEALAMLRQRFPQATDGILFCVAKLEQNPNLGLRDLRPEAKTLGISLAGRSLHSARGLIGLAPAPVAPKPPGRRNRPPARVPRTEAKGRGRRALSPTRESVADMPVETRLLSAVRQLQEAAAAESQRLRTAIEAAIVLLHEALERP